MNVRYGQNVIVHMIGLLGPPSMGYLAYRSSVDHFVVGGITHRIGLVLCCVVISVAVAVSYLLSGVSCYEISDPHLVIRRPWGRVFIPWHDIKRINWNTTLNYVVIRGESSIIAFFSTDFFPNLMDFLSAVHQRSDCDVPSEFEWFLSLHRRDD